MKKIAIIGGGLQGIEIAFLAKEAGYRTLLLDKKPEPPALGLVDKFIQADVNDLDNNMLRKISFEMDMIIPAFEDYRGLQILNELRSKLPPLVLDFDSYKISSSKKASRVFFEEYSLPYARTLPEAEFPLIIKPDDGSGSQGVNLVGSEEELLEAKEMYNGNFLIEEFLTGPAYSIEVLGFDGEIYPLEVTRLIFDDEYDCRKVLAGSFIDNEIFKSLKELGKITAEKLNLQGIMDLEVVATESGLKLLEIDARFPSQTPTAVYRSSGINMVKMLADLYLEGETGEHLNNKNKAAIYEQIYIKNNKVFSTGEHIMTKAGRLEVDNDFFGADFALTDYSGRGNDGHAILHFWAENLMKVEVKSEKFKTDLKSFLLNFN